MPKKNVDIQLVSIESDVANQPVHLDTVLVALNGFKKEFNNKSFQLKLWDSGDITGVVSGIVITEQIKDLPPKRNKDTGEFSSLGLQPNETLAYGNAFLYDKSLEVIFYEVNGNGYYLDQFSGILIEEWNNRQNGQQNQIIDINFVAIPKNGGYRTYQSMYYLKEFVFEIACPHSIIQEYHNNNSTLLGAITPDLNRAVRNNADVMQIRYATFGKKGNRQGLDGKKIKKLVDAGMFILRGGQRSNVKELKVVGFETDSNGKSHKTSADLIADLLKGSITLPSVEQNKDLQEDSRKSQIELLHSNLTQTLCAILQRQQS